MVKTLAKRRHTHTHTRAKICVLCVWWGLPGAQAACKQHANVSCTLTAVRLFRVRAQHSLPTRMFVRGRGNFIRALVRTHRQAAARFRRARLSRQCTLSAASERASSVRQGSQRLDCCLLQLSETVRVYANTPVYQTHMRKWNWWKCN